MLLFKLVHSVVVPDEDLLACLPACLFVDPSAPPLPRLGLADSGEVLLRVVPLGLPKPQSGCPAWRGRGEWVWVKISMGQN